MTQADDPRRDSIPGLARRLISGFVQLAKLEITRGRQRPASTGTWAAAWRP